MNIQHRLRIYSPRFVRFQIWRFLDGRLARIERHPSPFRVMTTEVEAKHNSKNADTLAMELGDRAYVAQYLENRERS